MYLTYAEYQTYGGTLGETDFNRFEMRAGNAVNTYTGGKLIGVNPLPAPVKPLMFDLIGVYANSGGGKNYSLSSERVGDYSATYATYSASAEATHVAALIESYLGGVVIGGAPLTYNGVGKWYDVQC